MHPKINSSERIKLTASFGFLHDMVHVEYLWILNRTGFIRIFIQVNQTKLLNKPLKFVVMNLADISLIWLFLFPQKSENWKNIMEDLMPHLAKIKAPFGQEKVYKEECTFSFDNPVSIENSRDGI